MAEEQELPIPDGKTRLGTRAPVGELQIRPLKLGSIRTLAGLDREFLFFTPAMIYMFLDNPEGRWTEFCQKRGSPLVMYHHRFNKPLFAGMVIPQFDPQGREITNESWNYTLFALPKADEKAFLRFMTEVLLSNPEHRWVSRTPPQHLTIADPLQVDMAVILPAVPRRIPIVAFGIASSEATIYLQVPPRHAPEYTRPFMTHGKPDPEMLEQCRRLFTTGDPHYTPPPTEEQLRLAMAEAVRSPPPLLD